MFDPAALDAVVQRVLANSPDIPEDAHGAFVTVANQDGIRAVIAVKLGGDWKLQADVAHGWREGTKVTYGVNIVGTF